MSAGRSGVWPRATTRVTGVIGDPVRHSLSPALHNAAFAALGLDWVYLAFHVPTGSAGSALLGMRALGLEGLSVTMPHKVAVAAAVDRRSPTVAALGSANTVVRRGGLLIGESTDGEGFLAALRDDQGWSPAGHRCVVLGTGGAAGAVTLALAQAGAAEVGVVGRRHEMAEAIAGLAGRVGRAAALDAAEGADLVVNATPVGMSGVVSLDREPLPSTPFDLDTGRLGRGQLVVDLVYSPVTTPLLDGARRQGAATANGLGMLIHQAALQFRLWTGENPPLETMSAAALAALSR